MAVGILGFLSHSAFARKPLLPGRAQGMATVDVNGTTLQKLEAALQKVFVEGEGYSFVNSGELTYVFERPAGRMKDLSYGGLVSEGTTERAIVQIEKKSDTSFRLECNAQMVQGGDPFFEDSTEVLRVFGKEYQRILRRVQREAK
jgi:hypothetical protein